MTFVGGILFISSFLAFRWLALSSIHVCALFGYDVRKKSGPYIVTVYSSVHIVLVSTYFHNFEWRAQTEEE